jgi:asparagine synthase (glutamine-hydrolysing)
MCGICGIINYNSQTVEESQLRQMMHLMKHRGPDDEGVFIERNFGFGFVRLSIIDLSQAGHQPKVSADGNYIIVFNGEVYNYIELREELINEGISFETRTDTEVILNAYIHWGEECLHRFNGMWACAIFNRKDNRIFIARDRFGIKPFYYFYNGEQFAFCSEIPPLLSLLKEKPQPDYQSIFDYLVFNRTDQTESTFFKDIRKLQHGHSLLIDLNLPGLSLQSSIHQWYNLRDRVTISKGFKNPKEFLELFNSAIGMRLRSEVPVGVCLSGGIDSSSIVSVLLKDFNKNDLNTFSAVYHKGQTGDETGYIQEYSALLKNMFYIIPDAVSLEKDLMDFVKAHGEPVPKTGVYAQFKVMELAKGKVVVTIDGQGADEEFAGYHYFFGFYFKDLLIRGRLVKFTTEVWNYLFKHKSFFGIKTLFYFLLPKKIRTKTSVNSKGYLNEDFVRTYKNENSVSGNIYGANSLKDALLDHFEFKLEHLLKWEDRNSMWFSLEARVPFLDYRIVEKVLATSEDLKIKGGMTKYLLREAMKGILPEKIRNRRDKIGFDTPQDEWFRSPAWQTIIFGILNSDSFRNRSLINTEKALKQYQDHLSGKCNVSQEIWKWVNLELWFRKFID